ncbi:hypothetical protein GCM10010441_40000 [Kitasatospora paracochleata]|uniref:Uncharacterized protein n=1 Tax=Kitasatospora paracochleata TaxID=58354 RepID=A0ABT1IXN5_9ACTN|nr:hypothetical protein [Kitasatospora paracochleata]MCP2309281.1 hypothetical protein [Kitasatospora paracochleata]
MSDSDLTVGELGRMVGALREDFEKFVEGVYARLDRVVSTEVYAIQTAHVDQRLNDLARDISVAQRDAQTALASLEAYKLAEVSRRERERQTRLAQLVLPVLLAVFSAAVSVVTAVVSLH